jgi:hypothetical protein
MVACSALLGTRCLLSRGSLVIGGLSLFCNHAFIPGAHSCTCSMVSIVGLAFP